MLKNIVFYFIGDWGQVYAKVHSILLYRGLGVRSMLKYILFTL